MMTAKAATTMKLESSISESLAGSGEPGGQQYQSQQGQNQLQGFDNGLANAPGSAAVPDSGVGPNNGFENSNGNGFGTSVIKVDDPPKFDLDPYIANYTGRTRFDRLFLIGTCSSYLSIDALKAAVAEAKSGIDISRYERAVQALLEIAPSEPDAYLDQEWVERTKKSIRDQTDRLEHELKASKNNLIKESIRMCNEDLGRHYHQMGDTSSASKAFARMRDFCTTPSHIASMLFNIINVAIDRGDWLAVQSNLHRLRNLQSKPEDKEKYLPKMSAAMGLSHMAVESYFEAAHSFLIVDPSLGDSYKEILTSNDVAVYGGLCALASMDRNDLQRRVLDNSDFRNFLELEPHIRRAISFFCSSKFRPCLDILEAYRTDYLLDLRLQRHVSTLYTRIRTKSIQQYLVPFSRVTLDAMAKIFAPTVVGGTAKHTDFNSSFVQELIRMIEDGTLDARIDLERGLMVSKQTDLRAEIHNTALETVRTYLDEAHLRLLRANIIYAGLEVRAPPGDKRNDERASGKVLPGGGGKAARSAATNLW